MLSKTNRAQSTKQSVPTSTSAKSVPNVAAPESTPVTESSVPDQESEPVKEPVAEPEIAPETYSPEPKDKSPATDESRKSKDLLREEREKEKARLNKFMLPTLIEVNNAYRYAQADEKVYLIMPNFSNDYNVPDSVKERFMAHNLMRKEAFSKSAIKKITGVKHIQFEKTEIMYTIYEVLRDDNSTQYFCDNDLLSINPSDLIPLGRRMKQKMKEGKHLQDKVAFERIVRCMDAFVKHRRQVDFQVGLDHRITELSIAAPNVSLEGIDRLIVGTLVEKPEEGIVFRRPGEKCFFRMTEAHKYSDSIVDIVMGSASIQKERGDTEDRLLAEKFFKKLDSLKKLRILTSQFHKIVTNQPDALY